MAPTSDPSAAADDRGSDLLTSFDRYARLVQQLLGVPVALVTVVERDRQVFRGQLGLPEPWASRGETPLTHSFCQYVVADQAPLVIADARDDERLRDNLAIEDLGVVAYAGHPIVDHTGTTVGSLCAIDQVPRRWTAHELERLADLAGACSAELAHRGLSLLARDAWTVANERDRQSRVLLSLSHRLSETRTLADVASAVERVAREQWGCPHAAMWLRTTADDPQSDPSGAGTRHLLLAAEEVVGWRQAHDHPRLAVTSETPVGAAYRSGDPQYLDTRTDQWSDQVGGDRVFVPLRHSGVVHGVLVLDWESARPLGQDVADTVTAMSLYTAQAVAQARLLDERAQAATTLQEAMLTPLPDVAGLDLAARYRPAAVRDQVGGDWYDAVTLPSGGTALVIGDVVGHDIGAAATMGALRTTLRTLAWTAARQRPATVVEQFETVVTDLVPGAMCSLVYAHALPAPRGGDGCLEVHWSSAGHPAPLVLHPDGTTTWHDDAHGAMIGIGVGRNRPRGEASLTLTPGSTLLLFTDGLIERRRETLDAGLARLAEAVARHATADLDALIEAVLDDVLPPTPEDDVAVIAARCRPA
ncbi:SpoIIE family protein phosphatase [Nocardioides sp. C4-1]|uniref:GAF domain-containing SpoIIE family protein phosphatase n=1 Tax=Nocardioides sp. C4-1 TaxID=3151851 RepID=UPI00326302C7